MESSSKPGQISNKTRILIFGSVSVLIFGLLMWQHFHGGVPAHHILHQKDLPEISNWWGGLLLPVLAWILPGRIEKRLREKSESIWAQPSKNTSLKILGLFVVGLSVALLITFSFRYDYQPVLSNLPYFFLILGFTLPIYYAEFIFGFILGMTYSFGAVLPTVFVLFVASIGFLIYRYIRPLVIRSIT